jgi:fructuronate reductase
MDCSIKIPIRFGETIKAWKKAGKNCSELKYIPLVFAGWLRYLLGINDESKPFEVSPDPNYETLSACLSGINLGQKGPFHEKLQPVLSNPAFFGVNLYETGQSSSDNLGERVEKLFTEMLEGPGAVRKTLSATLS